MRINDTPGEFERIMHYARCHEDVTRKGHSEPCDKTATGIRLDPEDDSPYPVCAYHSRADMVPLSDILDRLT